MMAALATAIEKRTAMEVETAVVNLMSVGCSKMTARTESVWRE
jgi:hypothetical protein